MTIVTWVAANWQAVVSIGGAILAVGVSIAHLIHKDSVADKLQGIEETLNGLLKK